MTESIDELYPIITYAASPSGGSPLVTYGWTASEPVAGQPITLYHARRILRWTRIGLLGTAVKGPQEGSRLTHAVPRVLVVRWDECCDVEPEAAEELDAWPSYT